MRRATIRLFERARSMLVRGDFRPAVLKLVGGSMLGRLVMVAASPLITRLFGPAAFGEYAAAIALISILIVVADLSYHIAIGLPEREEDAANVAALSMTAMAGFGLLAFIVMTASGGAVLSLFGIGNLIPLVPLIVVGQVATGISVAFATWATRVRRFGSMAIADMSESISGATVQVVFGLLGLGVAGLLGGWVVGAIVGASLVAVAIWRVSGSAFSAVSIGGMWAMARRYRRFAILTTPSVLMNAVGLRAPLLLLLFVYGPEVGGQYALAERVAILPVTLTAAAVAGVYYSHAAPLARRADDSLKDLFKRTTRSLALFALLPMVFVAIVAPLAFGFIFGQEWVQAGVFAAALTPWFYLTLVTNPTGRTLDVLERQDLHLTRESVRLGVLALTSLAVIVIHPDPVVAVLMLTVAGCTTYLLYGYISWRAIVSPRPRPGARPAGPAPEPSS